MTRIVSASYMSVPESMFQEHRFGRYMSDTDRHTGSVS